MEKIDSSLAFLMKDSGLLAHLQQASRDVLDDFAFEVGQQVRCGSDSNELRGGVDGASTSNEMADDGE